MHLTLKADHAFARDAVHAEIDLKRDLNELVGDPGLFEVRSKASSKEEYLVRPDKGRRLDSAGADLVRSSCRPGADVQIVLGDGLSATALVRQGPPLARRLIAECKARNWTVGDLFFVRYARVGLLNDIGELLQPTVVVLLIGERPGMATAESLSAYLAYRPKSGDTDAKRNLISNIHAAGVPIEAASSRIIALIVQMMQLQISGVAVKEELSTGLGYGPASQALQNPPNAAC
jgi:ethanolamine ammonia-lyase small subunit